jgi:hypothetical protein
MMKKSKLKERTFTVCFGIAIFCISFLLSQKTLIQQKVLRNGTLITKTIDKTTSKRTIKSIYVKIDDQLYFAGHTFGKYDKAIKGDTIKVYYLEGERYVVLEGITSYLRPLFGEYLFILVGIVLIFMGIFYREKKKSFLQPESITVNSDLNKNDIREIIDSSLPINDDLYKLDIKSVEIIKGNISALYKSNPQILMNTVYELLLEKNEKAGTIYDALIEKGCLTERIFINEFQKVIKLYDKYKIAFYLGIIQLFLISEQSERIEMKEKLKWFIEQNSFIDNKTKKELLAFL